MFDSASYDDQIGYRVAGDIAHGDVRFSKPKKLQHRRCRRPGFEKVGTAPAAGAANAARASSSATPAPISACECADDDTHVSAANACDWRPSRTGAGGLHPEAPRQRRGRASDHPGDSQVNLTRVKAAWQAGRAFARRSRTKSPRPEAARATPNTTGASDSTPAGPATAAATSVRMESARK